MRVSTYCITPSLGHTRSNSSIECDNYNFFLGLNKNTILLLKMKLNDFWAYFDWKLYGCIYLISDEDFVFYDFDLIQERQQKQLFSSFSSISVMLILFMFLPLSSMLVSWVSKIDPLVLLIDVNLWFFCLTWWQPIFYSKWY